MHRHDDQELQFGDDLLTPRSLPFEAADTAELMSPSTPSSSSSRSLNSLSVMLSPHNQLAMQPAYIDRRVNSREVVEPLGLPYAKPGVHDVLFASCHNCKKSRPRDELMVCSFSDACTHTGLPKKRCKKKCCVRNKRCKKKYCL